MSRSIEAQLEDAQTVLPTNPKRAEEIYKEILSGPASEQPDALRQQETALVKLGELYRDHKSVVVSCA